MLDSSVRWPQLFLALCLGWIVLANPTPAAAGSFVGLEGKCLDVEGGSTADGTPVVLWECNSGENQRWELEASGLHFQIRGIGDKCLRPNPSSGDSQLSIGPCDGNDRWQPGVGFPNSSAWIHTGDGQCMDVEGSNTANGTPVILFACNGNANQRWQFVDEQLLPPGFLVGLGDKCADVEGAGTADGTPVVLWDCLGNENQIWEVESVGPSVRFRGLAGKCLQPEGASGTANTRLVIGPCDGVNDRWQYSSSAPVFVTLVHVSSGQCMDVENANTLNGTPINLFPCHGQANQIWSFEPETVDPSVCFNSSQTICLNGRRFKVEVEWEDFEGTVGEGSVLSFRSDDSGLFWFFDQNNWELLVKVLDGCDINNHFWVFSAATTDVKYTLRVTDTQTGDEQIYVNALGQAAAAVTDTDAFATCP